MLAPAAMAIMCYPVEVLLPYSVCTYYASTGDTVCHTQYGWFDAWECWTSGGGGEPYYPPPSGGGSPTSNPPPDCEIVGISDENTNQTVLSVWANDAVVEMSVAINGSTISTVSGRTDQFMLQGAGLFGDGTTPITVSCRNIANVYDQPVAEVYRRSDVYNGATTTHGYWQKLSLDGEPEEFWGDWYRKIDLLATNTSYSVPTFGERNGEWEHLETEDHIEAMGDTPRAIWDAVYQIHNPQLFNVYQAYPCKYELIRDSMCTSVYAFSRGGSPTGTGVMTGMQIPFQSTFDVWILAGDSVPVTPY
jgi:hypothetical protein